MTLLEYLQNVCDNLDRIDQIIIAIQIISKTQSTT